MNRFNFKALLLFSKPIAAVVIHLESRCDEPEALVFEYFASHRRLELH